MRLPLIGDGADKEKIDIPLATRMMRTAIDAGVNYVDTAWPYHGNDFPNPGASEPFVGAVLKDGYREKVYVATKLPVWNVETRADMDRLLDEQLKRLDMPYLDVYLVHNLNAAYWPKMRDLNVFDFLDGAVKDGRIRHPGFSFHASLGLFKEILNSYDWPVVQIQYNYLDTAYQAGEEGFKIARDKGSAVVIMEPLRGGFLIDNVPDQLKKMLKDCRPEWSLADWALRWIWSQEGVGTVLSGMSTMEQTEENLKIAASPADFGSKERDVLSKVRTWFMEHMKVNCTTCGYCLPCPKDVHIPEVFTYYNEYHMADDDNIRTRSVNMYKTALRYENRANSCVACHVCEKRCPQNIPIAEKMQEAVQTFTSKK
jgi:predicted aldo/keto reductase-like oxidoreductase